MPTSADDVDFERLSTHLKALAHPARLEILWRLRIPAAASDIVVRPRRKDAELQAERAMSRQSIMEHIETLESVGVVNRMGDRDAGQASQYVTSAQLVFALIEDLRRLSAIEPSTRVDVDATMAHAAGGGAAAWPTGAKLVLVGGPWEGRAFGLTGEGPWVVGRSREQSVALTYDPFASAEHARITKAGGRYQITSLPGARNPALVNFAPLQEGRARGLAAGDIIGCGRSLLVFQPE